MTSSLTPATPDRAVAEINRALRKQAQQEAEAETAYLYSATALSKNFDLLRGEPSDGQHFLEIVKILKDKVALFLRMGCELAAQKNGIQLAKNFPLPSIDPELKLRLITAATDYLALTGRAMIEGKDMDAAIKQKLLLELVGKAFDPSSVSADA